ncbi:phage tail protein [Rahnella sp. PD12R]|uniref:phage tail-collar fiber domain-containing protein n=1 Tax=Rahnella sp. PD12R TaxID=2855688 RepID=UPI001C46D5DF|nr:phage tail protein [Rahnella sp. PD12R]MBV6819924.1 phage tail protein [Rahnella sp. PD12R]
MSTFKSVVTTLGQARIAAAIAAGTDINITKLAVGDGNGKATTPVASQTKLVKEVYRTPLNSLKLDPSHGNWVIAEAVLSASVGGFWMREMGLFSSDGALIAVCNMADTYKPTLAEGSGRTQTLRMVIAVSNTEAISLLIDDSVIMATEQYVNDLLAAHEKSRNHPDGTTAAKGFVQLSSSVSSTSEALAATPKAVKAANDNANTRVPSTRKINGKALSADQTLTAVDVGGMPLSSTNLGNTNINTFGRDKFGIYSQTSPTQATVANGYPAMLAGILEVFPGTYTNGVIQRYTEHLSGKCWQRASSNVWNGTDGPWSDWVQSSTVGSVAANSALGSTDLNTVGFSLTAVQAAIYHQSANASATADRNYPEAKAGTLFVTGSAYGCQQMFITFDTCNIWVRGLSSNWNGKDGPWRPWVALYGTNNKPTAADVGAWTATQSAASEKALSDEIATAFKIRTNLTATDTPNTLRGSSMFGHYGVPGAAAATTEKGYPINNFVGVIFVTWGPNATQQIAFNNNGRQFTRSMTGAWNGVDGPWSAWNEIYCQANKPTPADVGALPAGGTAVAASKLATARKIAGVAFDGTKDINLTNSNVGLGNVGNFAAVQQGGGAGMQSNKVYIGWTGSKVKIQVDASDMGEVYTTNFPPPQQDLSGYARRDWITYVGLEADNPNAPYMRRASNNALVYLATSAWSDSRFIYDVQRGSQALENAGWTAQQNWEAPTGCFMTGLNIRSDMGDCRMMGKYYRALMIRTASGSWRQVGN